MKFVYKETNSRCTLARCLASISYFGASKVCLATITKNNLASGTASGLFFFYFYFYLLNFHRGILH